LAQVCVGNMTGAHEPARGLDRAGNWAQNGHAAGKWSKFTGRGLFVRADHLPAAAAHPRVSNPATRHTGASNRYRCSARSDASRPMNTSRAHQRVRGRHVLHDHEQSDYGDRRYLIASSFVRRGDVSRSVPSARYVAVVNPTLSPMTVAGPMGSGSGLAMWSLANRILSLHTFRRKSSKTWIVSCSPGQRR
jgi:hypothetical protein